jgi:electron transfer flavoprotein beta subunit
LHVVVCMKQVLDQEIPPRAFRVDRAARRPDVPGAALVTSIFDANALEAALRLREAAGGEVTALSLGPASAEEVLRRALAVTADRAVLLSDEAFSGLDPAGVATCVAAAVRRLGAEGAPVDVVLTGRQAGDVEHGQTGGMIAEALGWPCLSFVTRLAPGGDGLSLWRQADEGRQVWRARPPLVATVTNDPTNQLRLAKVRDVMLAHRRPVVTWGASDLGLAPADLQPRVELLDLFVPEKESRCEMVGGETPAEKGRALARRLRELKIV